MAAENADLIGNTGSSDTDIYVKSVYVNCEGPDYEYTVNKESILNTIKQVE